MRSKLNLRNFIFLFLAIVITSSCEKEPDRPVFPLSAQVFFSVKDKQVAFTALTHSATSWTWDFGDGKSSTEKDPVHVYEVGGYYVAKLTATDAQGNTASKEVKLAIALTPYALLTGDHTAAGYKGKTWKLMADHVSGGDYFANANATFTTVSGTPRPLTVGIFDLQFGMGNIYKDEFTFYHDGKYVHDVKEDGGSFGGYLFNMVTGGPSSIINANGAQFGLCIAKYTPETNATFTFVEKENFAVPSVYDASGVITYPNVSTLNFSGSEFIGFRDFQRKVILRSISNTRMQLVMFMAAAQAQIPKNSHALILSFEAVN
jgi:hypothetical protein